MDWHLEDIGSYERLERLKGYPTHSHFCRDFYRVIHRRIIALKDPHEALSRLFNDFLESQIHYHEGLERRQISDENFDERLTEAVPVLTRRMAAVKRLLERMDVAGEAQVDRLIPLRLMRAECHYQINETEQVIEDLEAAHSLGCHESIVQFALGYNVYAAALEECADYDPEQNLFRVRDFERFQEACFRAARSFERALSGSSFDVQIFWWLGMVLEAAGDHRRAHSAYRQVSATAPGAIQEEARRRIARLLPAVPDASGQEEQSRLAELPAITERESDSLLEGVETVGDLLKKIE
ncbi:MAG: hypothetical protein IT210_02285 [Armatimonadetes bacterium]|nr:hypothetical protein [Armatimonadota bacterium]